MAVSAYFTSKQILALQYRVYYDYEISSENNSLSGFKDSA